VVARAGVAESAFYEVFQSAEDCFLAAFEEGLERLSEVVRQASGCEARWLGRVRAGLVALLGFFDDEPGWGRMLVYQAPLDAVVAFRCQQRVLGVLSVLIDDGSPQVIAEIMPEPRLTAELLVGGVFSVIRARMLKANGEALVELAPSLMAFIVRPYLGHAAASVELVGRPAAAEQAPLRVAELEPPLSIPFRHRSALVLRAIACVPRSSNREIAEAAGLTDKGQTSHLLRRLAQRGLIEKVPSRSGSRRENAWLLTPYGRRVIKLLGVEAAVGPCAGAHARVGEAA
jgi:DNA-binding MarR family transcriptional regulator